MTENSQNSSEEKDEDIYSLIFLLLSSETEFPMSLLSKISFEGLDNSHKTKHQKTFFDALPIWFIIKFLRLGHADQVVKLISHTQGIQMFMDLVDSILSFSDNVLIARDIQESVIHELNISESASLMNFCLLQITESLINTVLTVVFIFFEQETTIKNIILMERLLLSCLRIMEFGNFLLLTKDGKILKDLLPVYLYFNFRRLLK